MSDRIRGRYPGGPSRVDEGADPAPPRHLPTVEEIEVGIAQATRMSERRSRRRRVWLGFVGALIAAAAVGFGVGRAVRPPSPEDMLPSAEQTDLDRKMQEEVNRVLVEEWRMEDVQYARGQQPQPSH